MSIPSALTVTTMAEVLGVKRRRLDYIVQSRRIKPAGVAGTTRFYDRPTFDRIASEVRRMGSTPISA